MYSNIIDSNEWHIVVTSAESRSSFASARLEGRIEAKWLAMAKLDCDDTNVAQKSLGARSQNTDLSLETETHNQGMYLAAAMQTHSYRIYSHQSLYVFQYYHAKFLKRIGQCIIWEVLLKKYTPWMFLEYIVRHWFAGNVWYLSIHTWDYMNLLSAKVDIEFRALNSCLAYASFEEDRKSRKKKWNSKYQKTRPVMWDVTISSRRGQWVTWITIVSPQAGGGGGGPSRGQWLAVVMHWCYCSHEIEQCHLIGGRPAASFDFFVGYLGARRSAGLCSHCTSTSRHCLHWLLIMHCRRSDEMIFRAR